MPKRPSSFALYNWFPEHGADLVHAEDRDDFARLMPAGRVFGVAREDDWFVLMLGDSRFRVRADLLQPVPAPRHWLGDRVNFVSGGQNRQGTVRSVHWHFRDNAPYYLLSIDGKPLSKRYLDDDLIAQA